MEVILSAGHGGTDPGAINGVYQEKVYTLDIESRVAKLLEVHGVKFTRVRTNDTTVKPNDRALLVSRSGAKYCLDIHINAGGGEGVEVIHSVHAKPNLAIAILEEVSKVGLKKRRVYSKSTRLGKDYYYMHRQTGNVETVIIECGFIDNPRDLDFLKVPSNRAKIAKAIVKGFLKHTGRVFEEVKEDGPLYRVQVGAFKEKENAIKLQEKLKKEGYNTIIKEGQ